MNKKGDVTQLNNTLFEHNLYSIPSINTYPAKNFPAHYHKHVEFIYVTSGYLYMTIDEKTVKVSKGEGALVFPYRVHEYRLENTECERLIIVFEPEYFKPLEKFFKNYIPLNPFISSENFKTTNSIINDIISATKNLHSIPKDSVKYSIFLSQVGLLLSSVLPYINIIKNDSTIESIYIKAVKYCCDNFANENFSIDNITNMLHISRSRLQHIFSEKTNKGIKEYINYLRLLNAEQMLITTDFSVTKIALESGFSTLRTFNRCFLKKNGISPVKFRKLKKF